MNRTRIADKKTDETGERAEAAYERQLKTQCLKIEYNKARSLMIPVEKSIGDWMRGHGFTVKTITRKGSGDVEYDVNGSDMDQEECRIYVCHTNIIGTKNEGCIYLDIIARNANISKEYELFPAHIYVSIGPGKGNLACVTEYAGQDFFFDHKPSANAMLSDFEKAVKEHDAVGCLGMRGYTDLTNLSEKMEVPGDLNLDGCMKLTDLPKKLHVGGNLYLTNCVNLTSLPEGLTVGGWLGLRGCTSLTSLPEGLRVDGWLGLHGCTSLTSLPEDFNVGKDIYLHGCTKLKVWLVKERKIEWLKRQVKGQIKGLLE